MERESASNNEAHPLSDKVAKLVKDKAVVMLGAKSCCLCYSIKTLFHNLGVSPTLVEVDEIVEDGEELEKVLGRVVAKQRDIDDLHEMAMLKSNSSSSSSSSCPPSLPMVFVGGEFVGGLDDVLTAHVRGTLVPRLKAAGALWL